VSSHTAERLTVRVEQQQLDARNAAEFKVALQELSPEQFSTLVLDLSEVRFVDSTGMGAIVACSKKLQEPGRLLLLKPQPAVRELLRLTRLDRFFEVLDHEDA
jgi:anti-sigma B factor antagonist